MDEITMIREFRACVDACDELARARARVALRTEIAAEVPAPAGQPIRQVRTSAKRDVSSSIMRRRRTSRRRVFLVAAVVSVVALAAVVPATLLPDERIGASPAAAETLEQLAAVAGAQPASPGGRYLYTKARTLYSATESSTDPFAVFLPSIRESWVAADGSGRIRETPAKPVFLSEADRERWTQTGGWLDARAPTDQRSGARDNFRAARNLPTEPDELEATLRAKAERENPTPEDGYTVTGELLEQIRSLLHSPAASSELRAALYRVMGRLDGVELVGSVTDPIGRQGVAISGPAFYGDGDTARRQLIFDPKTSAVLADQTILQKPVDWIHATPPLVIEEIVYVDSGWVNSVQARPDHS
ncbi:MAG: CU044_5270 family protein [Gaiellaceae bacterium]